MGSSADVQNAVGNWISDTLADPHSPFGSLALSMVLGVWSFQQFVLGEPVF